MAVDHASPAERIGRTLPRPAVLPDSPVAIGRGTDMNDTRVAQFADAYCARMIAAMQKDPSGWMDTPATAPALARRMTEGLATGRANLSAQGKSAAKSLGIHPTATAIRAWLCDPAPV